MADENKSIEEKPEDKTQQAGVPTEIEPSIVPENNTPSLNPDEVQPLDVQNNEGVDSGVDSEEENNSNEKGDFRGDETPNNGYNNDDQGNTPSENDGINLSKLSQEIDSYKKGIEEKRNKCVGWKLFLIVVCLIGVVCITRAFICDCENITENVYAIVILFGLLILLIIGAVLLLYLQVSCKHRYDLAINRLELLISRLKIKNDNKNKSTIISDIDRELQLIARILETNKDINKNINIL